MSQRTFATQLDDTSEVNTESLERQAEQTAATLAPDRAIKIIKCVSKSAIWVEVRDAGQDNKIYFFNVCTKETSIGHPLAKKGSMIKASKLAGLKKRATDTGSPAEPSSPGDLSPLTKSGSFSFGADSPVSSSPQALSPLSRQASSGRLPLSPGNGSSSGSSLEEELVVLPIGPVPSDADAMWIARRVLETIVLRSEAEIDVMKALEAALSEDAAPIEQLLQAEKPPAPAVAVESVTPSSIPTSTSTPETPAQEDPATERLSSELSSASYPLSLSEPSTPTHSAPQTPTGSFLSSTPVTPTAEANQSSAASGDKAGAAEGGKEKRKSKENVVIQIADAFRALVKKHPPEQQKTVQPFTVKDKFCVIHLAYLTQNLDQNISRISTPGGAPNDASSPGGDQGAAEPTAVPNVYAVSPDTKVLESDLKAYLPLRAAFRGDFPDLQQALENTQDEAGKIVLPGSGLTMLHLAICSGHAEMIRMVINKFPELIHKQANNCVTPLMLACLFGMHDVVELLLDQQANVNVTCAALPYCKPGSSIRLAIDHWCSQLPKDVYKLGAVNAALCAVFSGCLHTLQTVLVTGGVNVKTTYSKQLLTDALTLAILLQSNRIVKYLMEAGMGVNSLDMAGLTPLMLAAACDVSASVCDQLCQLGANINAVDVRTGNTCLHHAIMAGNVDFVKQLCRSKRGTEELAICLNHNNPRQQLTPLQLAAAAPNIPDEKRQKIASILKKYGALERRMYSEIRKEGFMVKEGHKVKSWKLRWFVLKEDTLSYYKEINKLKEAKGVIYLKGATILEEKDHKKKHCFSIYDAKVERKYYCSCVSEQEKMEWLEILYHCIGNLRVGRMVAAVTASENSRAQLPGSPEADK